MLILILLTEIDWVKKLIETLYARNRGSASGMGNLKGLKLVWETETAVT
jgi:hypothetical protein